MREVFDLTVVKSDTQVKLTSSKCFSPLEPNPFLSVALEVESQTTNGGCFPGKCWTGRPIWNQIREMNLKKLISLKLSRIFCAVCTVLCNNCIEKGFSAFYNLAHKITIDEYTVFLTPRTINYLQKKRVISPFFPKSLASHSSRAWLFKSVELGALLEEPSRKLRLDLGVPTTVEGSATLRLAPEGVPNDFRGSGAPVQSAYMGDKTSLTCCFFANPAF